jgi:hypothetical protein
MEDARTEARPIIIGYAPSSLHASSQISQQRHYTSH